MDCIIIGGGIGGLTTALALHRRGIEAHVFETAPQLREVGAGIWVPTNALQVLDRLGLAAAVQDAGRPVRRAEVYDVRGGCLQAVDLNAAASRYGFGTVAIHRARLQQILAERLPPETLHLGKAFTALSQEAGRVHVRFGDGSEVAARIVVAADGLRSAVRGQLFPGAAIRYSGQTSYRGIAQWRFPPELEGRGWEVWGAGCRFGFSAIAEEEVYWFAVHDAPRGRSDAPGTMRARLQSCFAAFPAPIPQLLVHTREQAITRTDLCDLRPMRSWHQGQVVLVGDAAHATTPNLGQGGAQAIEDAYVLADRLAARGMDPSRGFREYQRLRRPKAERIVRASWWLGKLAHLRSPVARALRNAAIRHTPAWMSERQFQALFQLNY